MSQTTVVAVRRFLRARTRQGELAGWTDRYIAAVAAVIVGALAFAPIRSVAYALSTSEPRSVVPGLVLAAVSTTAFMGALRWLGPVAMSARDAAWLLLSPLARGAVLRQPAFRSVSFFLGTAGACGLAALSVLGARDHLVARMALAMVLSAALALAGWVVALHAQRSHALRWTVPLAGLAAAPRPPADPGALAAQRLRHPRPAGARRHVGVCRPPDAGRLPGTGRGRRRPAPRHRSQRDRRASALGLHDGRGGSLLAGPAVEVAAVAGMAAKAPPGRLARLAHARPPPCQAGTPSPWRFRITAGGGCSAPPPRRASPSGRCGWQDAVR